MKQSEIPNWALKYKTKGTTIRKKGKNSFGLYKVTSQYVKGGYPKTIQTYLGVITEEGYFPKKEEPSEEVLEYGLSNFIYSSFHRSLQRSCYGSVGEDKEILIILAIIHYIFNDLSEATIRKTAISRNKEDKLIKRASEVNFKRITTIKKEIEKQFNILFLNSTQNKDLFKMYLLLETIPVNVKTRNHSKEVEIILRGLKDEKKS